MTLKEVDLLGRPITIQKEQVVNGKRIVVKEEDGIPKVVEEQAFISQMEIALYTDTVKVVCKKQDI